MEAMTASSPGFPPRTSSRMTLRGVHCWTDGREFAVIWRNDSIFVPRCQSTAARVSLLERTRPCFLVTLKESVWTVSFAL